MKQTGWVDAGVGGVVRVYGFDVEGIGGEGEVGVEGGVV